MVSGQPGARIFCHLSDPRDLERRRAA